MRRQQEGNWLILVTPHPEDWDLWYPPSEKSGAPMNEDCVEPPSASKYTIEELQSLPRDGPEERIGVDISRDKVVPKFIAVVLKAARCWDPTLFRTGHQPEAILLDDT